MFESGTSEDSPKSATPSYSDVLATTSREEKPFSLLSLDWNIKLKLEKTRRKPVVMTEQQIREEWSNKIITGLSEEFKAYNELDELDLNFDLPTSVFGIHHRSIVDIFLEDFRRVKLTRFLFSSIKQRTITFYYRMKMKSIMKY